MKTAIAHDYFYQNGGAEKVVELLLKEYDDAILFTTLFYPKNFEADSAIMKARNEGRVRTSFLQWFLANRLGIRFFKHFFWLYPVAMSTLRVNDFDALIISSSYPAKNIRLGTIHMILHYCHSPSRFLHNMDRETDMRSINPVLRRMVPLFTFWLKWLDVKGAQNLTKHGAIWFANATHMKEVIRTTYGVEAKVLYPPVETTHFQTLPKKMDAKEPYYFYFGRISFHKRIDILIAACAKMGRRFYICGGSGLQVETDNLVNLIDRLEKEYPGTKNNIKLLGRLSDTQRDAYLSGAQAFLFAGKEDFGIAPIEALASGTPIIMYKAGGALDYLKEGINGVFAPEQNAESFVEAISVFEMNTFDERAVRESARQFNQQTFINGIKSHL